MDLTIDFEDSIAICIANFILKKIYTSAYANTINDLRMVICWSLVLLLFFELQQINFVNEFAIAIIDITCSIINFIYKIKIKQ